MGLKCFLSRCIIVQLYFLNSLNNFQVLNKCELWYVSYIIKINIYYKRINAFFSLFAKMMMFLACNQWSHKVPKSNRTQRTNLFQFKLDMLREICTYEPTYSLLTALSFTDESIEYFALTRGLFWMNSTVKVKIINVQMTHHKQN